MLKEVEGERGGGFYPEETARLQEEWRRQLIKQSDILALKFAEPLELTRERYIEGLLKFDFEPNAHRDGLNTPMIVDPRMSIENICEMFGVNYFPDESGSNIGEVIYPETPDKPYICWTDIEFGLFPRTSTEYVLGKLNGSADMRGGTAIEAITLLAYYPDILEKHFLDCPGTVVGREQSKKVAILYQLGGKPCLDFRPIQLDSGHEGKITPLICRKYPQ